ncbi:MAG: AtpZ/AtpI family protein [Gemmatimonadetes bacterium]|nr:AtpZ/AtpI family protein [Gemmatimonadota bacterium]
MSEEGKPGDARRTEVIRASSHFLGHGMTFAASVALFGWVGFEVGTRIGAESLLLILGMLLGGAVGFYNLYLQVVVRPREDQGREEGEEN